VSPAAAACPHCGFPLRRGAAASGAETLLWEATPSLRTFSAEIVLLMVVAGALFALTDPLVALLGELPFASARLARDLQPQLELLFPGIVLSAAVARIARVLWRAVVVRRHRYRLSNRRLVVESGLLSREVREIDVRAIDDILLRQSLLGRLLGVGEIALVAAIPDGKGPRQKLRLEGLRDAADARDAIRDAAFQATRSRG